MHCNCKSKRTLLPNSLVNFLKIDSDTSLSASTGTSCGGQPPRKKKKLSPETSSAIVSAVDIAGNIVAIGQAIANANKDNPSSSCESGGVSDGMQEQGSLNNANGTFYEIRSMVEMERGGAALGMGRGRGAGERARPRFTHMHINVQSTVFITYFINLCQNRTVFYFMRVWVKMSVAMMFSFSQ